jgi:hypothetical protein
LTQCSSKAGWLAVALLAVFLSTVTAQERPREPSLEELEVEHLIDQASRVFEQHGLPIEEMSVDFQYRCLRAIGDTPFCECLLRKRPYTLRFQQYIGISSRTKAELDYDTLSDFGKVIVDRVFLVRDDCVAK